MNRVWKVMVYWASLSAKGGDYRDPLYLSSIAFDAVVNSHTLWSFLLIIVLYFTYTWLYIELYRASIYWLLNVWKGRTKRDHYKLVLYSSMSKCVQISRGYIILLYYFVFFFINSLYVGCGCARRPFRHFVWQKAREHSSRVSAVWNLTWCLNSLTKVY